MGLLTCRGTQCHNSAALFEMLGVDNLTKARKMGCGSGVIIIAFTPMKWHFGTLGCLNALGARPSTERWRVPFAGANEENDADRPRPTESRRQAYDK